ncbi:hypothetical protein NUACC26_003330 [Scytonema sp. NUACC26]
MSLVIWSQQASQDIQRHYAFLQDVNTMEWIFYPFKLLLIPKIVELLKSKSPEMDATPTNHYLH